MTPVCARPHPPLLILVLLASVLAVEVLAVTSWLDTASLRGRSGMAGVIEVWGPAVLRATLAFAAAFLLVKRDAIMIAASSATGVSAWWTTVHLVCFSLFAVLSAVFFQSSVYGNILAFLWLASGAAFPLAALLAVVDPRVFGTLLKEGYPALISAALASIAAVIFGESAASLGDGWTRVTFAFVEMLLRPSFPTMTVDWSHRLLEAGDFGVTIANSCSGMEGAGLVVAFSSLWLWIFRADYRFPHALLLAPVGVAAIWLLNGFRIAMLFTIGALGWPGIARGGFHSQAGWIAFTAVAVGIMWTAHRIPVLASARQSPASVPGERTEAEWYLLPFLFAMAAGMLTSATSSNGIDWLYPVRIVVAGVALWCFRRQYSALDWHFGWAGITAGIAVFALWATLERRNSSGTGLESALIAAPAVQSLVWLIVRAAGSTITVPLIEELAFRGYLLRNVNVHSWKVVGLMLLMSSVMFGALHGDRWVAGTLAGLAYGGAWLWRRRIGDAVVAHAITNGMIAWSVIVRGNWSYWA